MSDISVTTSAHQVEKRDWLLSQWGQGPGENPNVKIDVSAFTAGTHYPNGYIPSGTAVGVITAASSGEQLVVGPYDNAAADGRQTCVGLLHSAVKVPSLTDNTKDTAGALVVCGFVRLSRLPIALDAAGQTDLKLCHFTA